MEGKIIATRSASGYLIDVGNNQGRVFDIEKKIIFTPFNINSILARGYWEDYPSEGEEPMEVASLIKGAKEMDLEGNLTGKTF